jgi:hypothetical protein
LRLSCCGEYVGDARPAVEGTVFCLLGLSMSRAQASLGPQMKQVQTVNF